MSRIVLSSPAKLNLFLKVQNKRPDGYHNIVTVFERIDLADEISFRATPHKSIRIVCDHPQVPTGSKNLVCRAARLLQQESGILQGAEIRIKKRIPVAAGLAGGSSNAATALSGLDRIWKLHLSRTKLLSYARRIGSDVAFFLYDTSWALGTERGDHVKKLDIKTKLWQVLVVPRIKMYSWKVYRGIVPRPALLNPVTRSGTGSIPGPIRYAKGGPMNVLTKTDDDVNILIHNLKKGNTLEVGRLLSNDLETEIIRLCPRLKKLKEKLKSMNTKGVMISGSGPCVFGLTETEEEAEILKFILSKRFSQVFTAGTL